MAWKERASDTHGSFIGFCVNAFLRFFQFVLGITVIGLYATDLNNARKVGVGADSKWVFAVVIGALGAFSSLVYMVPFIKTTLLFAWDWIMFILWVAVFGLFGNMYIKENPEGDAGIVRMKNAVWVDLANMLLWFLTACYGTFLFFKLRRGRSLHTGRANV